MFEPSTYLELYPARSLCQEDFGKLMVHPKFLWLPFTEMDRPNGIYRPTFAKATVGLRSFSEGGRQDAKNAKTTETA